MITKRLTLVGFGCLLLVVGLAAACAGSNNTPTPQPAATKASTPASNGPATAAPTAAVDVGAELVQARCTTCHTLDRIKAAHKTQAEWTATVARMREHGAQVTDAEAATIAAHLAKVQG
jgi:mono/diheme cytochrome c family protein